jgi:phospholipase C
MRHTRRSRHWFTLTAVFTGAAMMLLPPIRYPAAARAQLVPQSAETAKTTTPIKHLIVIVGENHTFDNVFATYTPQSGQSVLNLLSEGIVSPDGGPGSRFNLAQQNQASDTSSYSINPTQTGPFTTLPQPNTTYAYGQPLNVPDKRFPANLPNGPFWLSQYTAYQLQFTGDPVHRFFQMWQDYDGGKLDLFTWVGVTIGTGSNGNPPPSPFTLQSTRR